MISNSTSFWVSPWGGTLSYNGWGDDKASPIPSLPVQLIKLILALLFVLWATVVFQPKKPRVPGSKVYGSKRFWEPEFLTRIRFTFAANDIIQQGCAKSKDEPFVVQSLDSDINILPMRCLDELRLVPRNHLSGKIVHYNSWPWASTIRDSDLHMTVLTKKLNQDLHRYVTMAYYEMSYGWNIDVPRPDGWTETDIQLCMRMLVARMSARVFVGHPTCRDPKWLAVTLGFSMDIFMAGFTLRMFPPWAHSIVAPWIPSRWLVQSQLNAGTQIVRQLLRQREEKLRNTTSDDGTEETLFEWMITHAVGTEGSEMEMGARQCNYSDPCQYSHYCNNCHQRLCEFVFHPEWLPTLTNEINETLTAYGEPETKISTKAWLQKLEKMDSFIVESQRLKPLILLTPQRIATICLKLRDVTNIPAGTRVAWAGHHNAIDSNVVPEPNLFDPMRSYRKRRANGGKDGHRLMAGQSDPDNMSFGYGGQVCPGRYFAVCEIKSILMRLLREFEFNAVPGKGTPKFFHVDENIVIDPSAKLMMRKINSSGQVNAQWK
ncbi:cytochrome P450 [Xylariaceae sp. FL1272]|nr:cytochrome P450 [Xylariaceae sp. FL1272]